MRAQALLLVVVVVSRLAMAADRAPSPRKEIQKKTIGKRALLGAAAGAGIQQAQNSPHEWGQGWAGLGKRFASGVGKHGVKSAIQVTVGTIRHEELSYRPSGKSGFGPRVEYALVSTVVTRKTTTGKKTFASGEVSGAVGAGFISRLWQPVRLHTVGSGIGSVGITLGVDAGMNVTREFWPEIRHPRQARARREH
jgi:hypothetical protein